MSNGVYCVRVPPEIDAAIARLQVERGLSRSGAMRTLLALGLAREHELPDAYFLGHFEGLEAGRQEAIRIALESVRSAIDARLGGNHG